MTLEKEKKKKKKEKKKREMKLFQPQWQQPKMLIVQFAAFF